MPGGDEIDQCPFCDAPWGECGHVRLLLEWEADALEREAQRAVSRARDPVDEDEPGNEAATRIAGADTQDAHAGRD